MARLTDFFVYHSGSSRCHRLDVRFKLIAMVILTLAVLAYGPLPLLVMSLLVLALCWSAGLSPVGVLIELRYFVLILAMVPAARAFTTPGLPLFDIPWLPVTREGVLAGAVLAWRFLLIAVFGLVFIASTRPSAVKAGVVYFLSFVPRLPAARIGTMLGLLLRFIPLVFLQSEATLDAQRARCIENRRNPVYRITRFVVPFLQRLFIGADRLSEAMEARCYSDRRTDPVPSSHRSDWWVLGGIVGTTALLSFL